MPPDPSSKGILVLGKKGDKHNDSNKKKTIWAEFNKVTDGAHNRYYSSLNPPTDPPTFNPPTFNLFVVSNKPLKRYEEIKKAVAEKKYEIGLPKGVSVICHENFQAYAGSFAHRGLYLPFKRKLETNREEEEEEEKTEVKKCKTGRGRRRGRGRGRGRG